MKKKTCKEIPAIQWLYMSGKKFCHQRYGDKKILTQTKSPIYYPPPPPPHPLKSQMPGPLFELIT